MLTLAIPNFNSERFLESTLDSLALNRPYVRWWFQDSASTDTSVTVATSYRTANDKICVEKDRGQADGLNRAFLNMGGDIVGYLNSDDNLAPDAARIVLQTFADNPDVDIVYGDIEFIDAKGRVTGTHRGRISNYDEVVNIYEVWWNRRQWVQPEVFWRRRVWDTVGQFDNSLSLAFDYQYWVRCFQHGCRVKYIPQVLAQFRIHPDQKSTRADDAACEIRKTVIHALTVKSLNNRLTERALSRRLSYDCYHRQEHFGVVSPYLSFPAALAQRPDWLALPGVRQRVKQTLVAKLSGN